MSHPLLGFTDRQRIRLFWAFLTLTIVATITLQIIDQPLRTAAAPQGIVSYELAGSQVNAARILDSWDEIAGRYAAFSLGFDFLYMLAYSVTLALLMLWSAAHFRKMMRSIGLILAWGMGLAAIADMTENYFLWQMLIHGPTEQAAGIAHQAALIKFSLILLAIVYALLALAHSARKR